MELPGVRAHLPLYMQPLRLPAVGLHTLRDPHPARVTQSGGETPLGYNPLFSLELKCSLNGKSHLATEPWGTG